MRSVHIVVCALAALPIAGAPAFASAGCSAFSGAATDQTKGEGGSRVGAKFAKGDTLTVKIHQDPHQAKVSVNLLEYASPDGPFRAVADGDSESFSYTVPESTNDFIYLNAGAVLPGMTISWNCTPSATAASPRLGK
jgi:hypothetical protein